MFDIIPQLIVNSIIASSFYALLAVGLSLLYGVMKINSFAHGAMALLGAYFFWIFYNTLGWNIIPSLLVALPLIVIVGIFLGYTVFMRVKDAHPLVSLSATIGVGLILQNIMLMVFEARSRSLSKEITSNILFDGKIAVTNNQIVIALLAALLVTSLFLFLKYTKIGKVVRAVADNKELSAILGINVRTVITVVVIISTLFAGIAGIMSGFDQNIHPNGAMLLNIKAFSAVILGGLGSIPGAVVGAFIIGFSENILIGIPFGDFLPLGSFLYLPSQFKDAIAFVVLILALYIKPYGIFGISREEAIKQ